MSDTASFLSESPAEAAEFEAARDESVTEAPEVPASPEPAKAEPEKPAPTAAEPAKPAADDRPKFVPHAALHEERIRRQALEKELADLRAGRQPEQAQQEIDPETDPIAALKEIRDFQQRQRQETEQQNNLRAFDARVQTHENDFAQATPDYGDAVAFLRDARAKQIVDAYAAVGKPITQNDLSAILLHEARSTSNDALQNGKNPGEVFYTLARSFGYTGKQAQAAAQAAVEAQPQIPALPVPSKADQTIDRITRGQKVASKAGGGEEGPETGELTLEQGGRLQGAAFDRWFDAFSKTQRAH